MQTIIVSRLTSFEHRQRLTHMIAYLIVAAAPNTFDVFNHIERSKHAAYLEAKKRISTASKPLKLLHSPSTSSNSTAQGFLSALPERARSTLLHYSLHHIMRCNRDKDLDTSAWKKCVTVSCTHSEISSIPTKTCPGLPSDRATAVRVDSVYTEGCRASAVSISALSDGDIASKFTSIYESCPTSNSKSEPVGCRYQHPAALSNRSLLTACISPRFISCGACVRMFECIPWSVTGLGVIALHLARSLLLDGDEQDSFEYLRCIPRVWSPSYLRWLCHAYLPHLLRDTSLATAEGVRGIHLLGLSISASDVPSLHKPVQL